VAPLGPLKVLAGHYVRLRKIQYVLLQLVSKVIKWDGSSII